MASIGNAPHRLTLAATERHLRQLPLISYLMPIIFAAQLLHFNRGILWKIKPPAYGKPQRKVFGRTNCSADKMHAGLLKAELRPLVHSVPGPVHTPPPAPAQPWKLAVASLTGLHWASHPRLPRKHIPANRMKGAFMNRSRLFLKQTPT